MLSYTRCVESNVDEYIWSLLWRAHGVTAHFHVHPSEIYIVPIRAPRMQCCIPIIAPHFTLFDLVPTNSSGECPKRSHIQALVCRLRPSLRYSDGGPSRPQASSLALCAGSLPILPLHFHNSATGTLVCPVTPVR